MKHRPTWLLLLLLVIGIGLSRRIVVCSQPCCAGHVKLAPSCDAAAAATIELCALACCGHGLRTQRAANDVAPPCGDARCGDQLGSIRSSCCCCCCHEALGVDLSLPPEDPTPSVAKAAAVAAAVLALPRSCGAAALDVVHPPATGPPRCDRRTALRATIVLLV